MGHSEKTTLVALLAGLVLLAVTSPTLAQCDLPLIVQQGSVAPNVLFVMDSSGSMNEPIFHEDFNPWIEYPGNFDTDRYYYIAWDGAYAPSDFKYYFPTGPKAQLTGGDCCGTYGWYVGNYLNWIYFHANDLQRASLPQETRIEVGKAAVSAVITQAVGLNYGLMRFTGTSGGKVVQDVGSDTVDLLNTMWNIAAVDGTPSGEALVDALEYFQREDSGAPIQFECQQNFIVFVTDGAPTYDKDVPNFIGDQDGDGNEPGSCDTVWPWYPNSYDCSDYMDDVAYYLSHNDMRGDLDGEQNVVTYSIGFALDHPLIEDTATNGDGLYMVAWNLESLLVSLGTVIGDIVSRVSSGAAVAVVSTESGDDNALYRGKFMPGLWRGFLEAYELPYAEGDAARWEAGQILANRDADDRNIIMNWFGTPISFDDSNADLMAGLLATTEEEATDVINYVRGEHVDGARDRHGWKLGDLVYSTPVVVGPPTRFYWDQDYQNFLIANKDRRRQVYVGSNDGMLHAFDAETGQETWGYVPWGVSWRLPDLLDPDYCHTSYVDLSPIVDDVKINGQWKTILFGGLRTGGASYFAIDVTNPYAPEPMWETWLPYIESSFTEPAIVQTNFMPVLWTGSAPSITGQAWSTATRIDTGSFIGATMTSAIAGTNMATAPLAYDKDFDGIDDYVYQADLSGNLWRYDVRDPDPAKWKGHVIFSGSHPIQARPAVAVDEDGNIFLFFGTGKYVEAADFTNGTQQRFYAVRDYDDEVPTTLYASDLKNQTNTISETEGAPGWYFDLENASDERVIEPAVVIDGVVYFTAFAPRSTECSAGGRSWLYSVGYLNGAGVKDQTAEEADSTDNRSEDLGDGVASRPVVNLIDGSIVVQTSDARLNIQDLETDPQAMFVRAWREQILGEYQSTTDPNGEQQQQ